MCFMFLCCMFYGLCFYVCMFYVVWFMFYVLCVYVCMFLCFYVIMLLCCYVVVCLCVYVFMFLYFYVFMFYVFMCSVFDRTTQYEYAAYSGRPWCVIIAKIYLQIRTSLSESYGNILAKPKTCRFSDDYDAQEGALAQPSV